MDLNKRAGEVTEEEPIVSFDICKSYQVVAPFAKEKLANCEAPDSVVKNAPDLQKPVEQNEK